MPPVRPEDRACAPEAAWFGLTAVAAPSDSAPRGTLPVKGRSLARGLPPRGELVGLRCGVWPPKDASIPLTSAHGRLGARGRTPSGMHKSLHNLIDGLCKRGYRTLPHSGCHSVRGHRYYSQMSHFSAVAGAPTMAQPRSLENGTVPAEEFCIGKTLTQQGA